ncbi:kinetochore protein Spc25 [Centroberyx gerrardi]|uniref:kinetochore protein Spc25 n=1 Tax=Centroberyx gerrardi TaxID=166262 RepID=UPI003AB08FC0
MASITDPNLGDWFINAMEEIRNKLLIQTCGDMIDTTAELCQSHKQFVKSAVDTCSKKCKDDETLFETIQTYKRGLEQNNMSMKEKRNAISETMSEIQRKEVQKDDIIQKTERLREEQVKKKELIVSQNKANKDRLRNLNKAKQVFQDRLGLEIRKIPGEKLQFIFRNINPADQDSAYTFTMGIKEDGSYQILSSDPQLDCLPALENRLQETNNFSAFLANVRKEFVSQARF